MTCSVSDYQLQQLKSGWRVVIQQVRGGKVRGYTTYSPIYKDKADAEDHLARRLESARAFQAHCNSVVGAMVESNRLKNSS